MTQVWACIYRSAQTYTQALHFASGSLQDRILYDDEDEDEDDAAENDEEECLN